MSRGLGPRQWLVLEALERLEGRQRAGERFHVWAVLREAGYLKLMAESGERSAAWASEDAACRADLEARSDMDDVETVAALKRQRRANTLGTIIRDWRRRENGVPLKRPAKASLEDINPSRIFALLEKRGLVRRDIVRGLGSSIALTAAGRAVLADRS
jgi:hypothetical protein